MLKTKLLQSDANHIELYGPSGVGKTYLLQHLHVKYDHVRAVYIDLTTCDSKDQIRAGAVKQLKNAQAAPASVSDRDLALSIRALHKPQDGSKPVTHFMFLFDSATESHRSIIDWLVSPDGLISNRQFLESLRVLGVRRDEIKLQVVIAARRPIVKISSYHSNLRLERVRIDRLRKHLNPEKDPIQGMLQELADHKEFPIALAARQSISDKVYYLTGGHPKCAKLALFTVAAKDFVPTADEWQECFKTSILPIIRGEMLASVKDLRLLSVFQNLSVLRCFNQRLLAALLERQVVPGILDDEPDTSRQARYLRKRLSHTYLVNEPALGESMYTINYPVRRALSLDLQYEAPRRFRAINSIALEIFAGWLQTAETTPDRAVLSLIELVYHWFKALELAQPPVPPTDIINYLQQALENYLPLLLAVIHPVDWSTYLPQLKAHWEVDQELKETIELVTEDTACYETLSRQLDEFVDRSIDNIADDISEES